MKSLSLTIKNARLALCRKVLFPAATFTITVGFLFIIHASCGASSITTPLSLLLLSGLPDCNGVKNGPAVIDPCGICVDSSPVDAYTDYGNGIVCANATGLIWSKDVHTNPGIALDYSALNAHFFCEGMRLGSIKGWRVPTLDELLSIQIADTKPGDALLDPVFLTRPHLAWTSSAVEELHNIWYCVDFSYNGGTCQTGPSQTIAVRCVQSSPLTPGTE